MTGAEALAYPPDRPEPLELAAARWDRLAESAARAAAGLARERAALVRSWEGPAAAACDGELAAVCRLVGSLRDPLHRSAGQLRAHAREVDEARAQVDALRRRYDDLLDARRAPLARVSQADVDQADLAAIHRRHDAVLAAVAQHAARTAGLLSAAGEAIVPPPRAGGHPVSGTATRRSREQRLAAALPMLADWRWAAGVGAGLPLVDAPADVVRRWWAALTDDERCRVVVHHPGRLGALAGLPAVVRSAANERRLAATLRSLRGRADLSEQERAVLRSCEVVRDQLARVRGHVDPRTGQPLTAQLLVFAPAAFGAQGRAAVAVGDLDTADDVAFLVPGLGATVTGALAGLTTGALRVGREARGVAPGRTVAVVAWLGYDAPGLLTVVDDDAAARGARRLRADVLAVQGARSVPPHVTVIGHSYGSTTTGIALRGHDLGADDVVLLGSPGAGVESARELAVPRGHVWVGAASRDPVSYLDWFGEDPAEAGFGGVRFRAESVTRNPDRLDVGDHVAYYQAGSESLSNVAHVVTGRYDAVVRAPHRHELPLLPDGLRSDPEATRAPRVVR